VRSHAGTVRFRFFDIVIRDDQTPTGTTKITMSPQMDGTKRVDEALAAIIRLAGFQWHGDSAYRIARLA
jgi:hypothetical protein